MFFKTVAFASLALLSAAAPVPTVDPITGPGILVNNKGSVLTEYCFFNNIWNGDGTAGPNFDNPDTCVSVAPGSGKFVPLAPSFKGRVQRGKTIPSTWGEFQLAASNDNKAHGDISIEQGCDGAVTIKSTDGTNQVAGFTVDLLTGAPDAATMIRQSDGARVLASTMGNWLAPANGAAASWAASKIDASKTYIVGGTGVGDVSSANQAFEFDFY
ncbi:hypothetical protein FGG08_000198 [Glutinoglossum americanum]|uniref:Uncharacterized protein n=1 Tax=Glutinoglossum americanum TaxID=1670608 RepID=A0A9P8IDK1_9PEZI|nr:hypothetical protein FGG08_000198 [Glutinoglossum americanum]